VKQKDTGHDTGHDMYDLSKLPIVPWKGIDNENRSTIPFGISNG
jgi:hypothetical protein